MHVVDVNLLIYAVNQDVPEHFAISTWLENEINAGGAIGMPWVALLGFIRLSINPKVMVNPLSLDQALDQVLEWISLPNVSILAPDTGHYSLFASACRSVNALHNLITDAHLAALAIGHGAVMASCDTDFAKFPGLCWLNPLTP